MRTLLLMAVFASCACRQQKSADEIHRVDLLECSRMVYFSADIGEFSKGDNFNRYVIPGVTSSGKPTNFVSIPLNVPVSDVVIQCTVSNDPRKRVGAGTGDAYSYTWTAADPMLEAQRDRIEELQAEIKNLKAGKQK